MSYIQNHVEEMIVKTMDKEFSFDFFRQMRILMSQTA